MTRIDPPPPLPDPPVADPSPPGGSPALAWVRLAVVPGLLALVGVTNPWMLVVILAVVVMIALHELGHYLMAKRAGMKVTEFFLGFGPKLWSTRRGETEYGIKLIPAGAYVKIPGMVNIDEVDPADEARTYRQKPFWDRVGVAVAGSAVHFLLALVLIFVALVLVGQPGGSLTARADEAAPVVHEVVAGSGAEVAGLQAGDQIVSIDGRPTPTAADLRSVVADVRGETVPVVVQRDGSQVSQDVSIRAFDAGQGVKVCGLGIDMAEPPAERVGPLRGVVEAPKQFGEVTWLSLQGLGRFFSPSGISDFASQVGSAQKDRNTADQQDQPTSADPCAPGAATPTTTGGSGSGENRILSIYGLVRLGSDVGGVDPGALIGLFALINIFIGVFNLIPLLPFDGGHVAIAVYERVQELRLHRRRYFADVSRLMPVTYVVVLLLGMLFFSSIYLDVVNPIGG